MKYENYFEDILSRLKNKEFNLIPWYFVNKMLLDCPDDVCIIYTERIITQFINTSVEYFLNAEELFLDDYVLYIADNKPLDNKCKRILNGNKKKRKSK